MGDDEIDVPAIRWAGIGISVGEACPPQGPDAARFIPSREAGRGAVREVCDLILAARGVVTSSHEQATAPLLHHDWTRPGRPGPEGWAQKITTQTPIKNFSLPSFNEKGFRTFLIQARGGDAQRK